MCQRRLCLFLACRKYLLRHLYSDLQDLSSRRHNDSGTPPVSDVDNIELETLPEPSTAAVKRTSALLGQRPFHSVLSRSLFALCFSESCTLFLLLMSQAFELLDSRWVRGTVREGRHVFTPLCMPVHVYSTGTSHWLCSLRLSSFSSRCHTASSLVILLRGQVRVHLRSCSKAYSK